MKAREEFGETSQETQGPCGRVWRQKRGWEFGLHELLCPGSTQQVVWLGGVFEVGRVSVSGSILSSPTPPS